MLMLVASCAKEVAQEPQQPHTTKPSKGEEAKDIVELSLEGLTDVELTDEARAIVFNPNGSTTNNIPYLKVGSVATCKARVYFVPKTGGNAFSGDTQAKLSEEAGKIKVNLQRVNVALPQSINTTQEWYVSVVLGGVVDTDNNNILAFNTQKMEGTLPEYSLPLVSAWQKVKVVPKTPTRPELGGASPVEHRAEHFGTERLSFRTIGSVIKVTPINSLMDNISVYDIRMTSDRYTIGTVAYPKSFAVAADDIAGAKLIEPTVDANNEALPEAGTRYTSIVPLGTSSNKVSYEARTFYANGDDQLSKLTSSIDLNFTKAASSPVYLMLTALPKADAVTGAGNTYLNAAVGRQVDKGKDTRVVSVSKKQVFKYAKKDGVNSPITAKDKVYATRLLINSEPMITEVYMRTNTEGDNVGVVEIFQPSLYVDLGKYEENPTPKLSGKIHPNYLSSLNGYGLVRMYREGNSYKFYPNADNLSGATVMPLKWAPNEDATTASQMRMEHKTESYAGVVNGTDNIRSANYHAFGPRRASLTIGAGVTMLVGMRGGIRAKTGTYASSWNGTNSTYWNKKGYPVAQKTVEDFRKMQLQHANLPEGIKFSWENERWMLKEVFWAWILAAETYDMKETNVTWSYSRAHGILWYDDASDAKKSIESLESNDTQSGVMNGSKDDIYLLVRKIGGKWTVVDMTGPIHSTGFASATAHFDSKLVGDQAKKHHVRHRVSENITAVSTEFDPKASNLDKLIVSKLWKVEPFKFTKNQKFFPECTIVAPNAPNTSLGYRTMPFTRKNPDVKDTEHDFTKAYSTLNNAAANANR